MPTVTVYTSDRDHLGALTELAPKLKRFVAEQLTSAEFELTPDAVSIRILLAEGSAMIAPVEVEMTAHAFTDRLEAQDEICRNVMDFIKSQDASLRNVRAWLILCQLGHSW